MLNFTEKDQIEIFVIERLIDIPLLLLKNNKENK